ncbi:MAG TPA: hypothetical protein VFA37_03190 [Gaiellaceae bacterium]|nr:hypothetical protein [Gaiellaceae bacterium]
MSTNWPEELRSLDGVAPSRDLWADAVARATAPRPRPARSRRSVVAVAVVALALIGAASAFAYHELSPSPGFTAGLSSLESLPTVPWPSSMPTDSLPQLASATGLTVDQAEHSLRLVQSGLTLGKQTVDLYAFPGKDGSACVYLVPQVGGICLPTWMHDNPALDGVAWAAWPGDGPMAPSGPLGVFGLVADNVKSVAAEVGGTSRAIPIVDNSFYAGYDSIEGTDAIALTVTFDDGTTRTFHAPNPYAPDNGPSTITTYSPPSP